MALLVPMLLLAAPLAATQPAPAPRAAISRAQDLESLAAMERELNLSGDELARFREKADAERQALSAWPETEKGRQFAALARERAAANRAKELDKAKALWEQMRPISAERSQLRREKRADVVATLTPAQLRQWAGYVLFTRVETDLARVALTDEQRAQIRAIADVHAGAAVEPEKVRDDPFLLSLHRLRQQVIAEARERVLTPQQIEKLRARRVPGLTTRPENAAPIEKEFER